MISIIRSLLFNFAFYFNLIIQMIIFAPFYFLIPRKKAWIVVKNWAYSSLWLQKVIVGTRYTIEGLEHIPSGAYICAPKHQSFWDVFAFLPYLDDPVMILKRELMWIPFFGWYVAKMRMIPVDRSTSAKALYSIRKNTRKAIEEGRQIFIYPEGTRRPPGASPHYKHGIVRIYTDLHLPVVPIAHNAGLYWPRRKFCRYSGTIHCRILPPIKPGLDRTEFLDRLIQATETACDELLIAAAKEKNPPPMPLTAVQRLKELRYDLKYDSRPSQA